MFYKYQIKKIQDEEVLFLYIDSQYEFAKDFTKRKAKRKSLLEQARTYIKNKQINFKGLKIFFVVNGIIVMSLLNTSFNLPPNQNLINQYVTSIHTENSILDAPNTELETAVTEEAALPTDPMDNKNNNSEKKSISKVNQESDSKKASIKTEVVPSVKEPESLDHNSPAPEEKPATNTELMINLHRANSTVISLSLTDYLIGVVAAEMPAAFLPEALKAQALVARTYTLRLIKSGRKLTDSISTQSYKDEAELRSLWGSSYNTYYQKIKTAVTSTDKEVILYDNDYIDAVYHSTSNGRTAAAIDVWGTSVPYLQSVDSHWDQNVKTYHQSVAKSYAALSLILGLNLSSKSNVQVISRTSNNSIKEMQIDGFTFTGLQMRTLLGLRSTDFDIIMGEAGIDIITRGYGHGVGMSQYGAGGMAKEGHDYQAIINHYYPGVMISRVSL